MNKLDPKTDILMEADNQPQSRHPYKTFQNLSTTKQHRIIGAAIDEFGKKGYAGASINSLVDQIGIAKGSIYQYFGDKKGLFLFVFTTCTDVVKNRLRLLREETAEDDLFSRLEKSLSAGITFLQEHPHIYKLYINVLFGSKIPFRDEILGSLREYSYGYLHSLLTAAQEKGELRAGVDINKICFVLDAVMDRFIQTRTISQIDAGLGIYQAGPEELRRWISDIMDIMRIGIGSSETIPSAPDEGARNGRDE